MKSSLNDFDFTGTDDSAIDSLADDISALDNGLDQAIAKVDEVIALIGSRATARITDVALRPKIKALPDTTAKVVQLLKAVKSNPLTANREEAEAQAAEETKRSKALGYGWDEKWDSRIRPYEATQPKKQPSERIIAVKYGMLLSQAKALVKK